MKLEYKKIFKILLIKKQILRMKIPNIGRIFLKKLLNLCEIFFIENIIWKLNCNNQTTDKFIHKTD